MWCEVSGERYPRPVGALRRELTPLEEAEGLALKDKLGNCKVDKVEKGVSWKEQQGQRPRGG